MTQDFLLLHRSGPERFRLPPENDGGVNRIAVGDDEAQLFSFTTCLRHIVIAETETIADLAGQAGHVLRGEEAYRFLLEVVCGLQSPLIGETEVAGQFKTAVASYRYPATPWGSHLAKTFKALLEDAKSIREAHLKDLGSQSYGSVLRREVRGMKSVHIIGAGHLVQEILPWVMKDGMRITIHARDTTRAEKDLSHKLAPEQLARVSFVGLSDRAPECDALVIAAPVSTHWVQKWVGGASIRFIADLRAESGVDRLTHEYLECARILELGQFMSRLSENQALLLARKSLALAAVAKAALERGRTVEYRPFGWEDVCA